MRLGIQESFLALHDGHDGIGRAVVFHDSLADALGQWTAGSRISPVWPIGFIADPAASSASSPAPPPSPVSGCLTFIGPVRPRRLQDGVPALEDAASVWASMGCFNIVVHTGKGAAQAEIAAQIMVWARAQGIAFEQWHLDAGRIVRTERHVLAQKDSKALSALLGFGGDHHHPAVRTGYQENVVATATSLARAAAVYPPIHDEIEQAAASMAAIMRCFAEGGLTLLEMQSRLQTMNAALSRFSSQAFSGIPPIEGTECHFWIHSLLGTGSANLALASLVASVQQVLGAALLPERLALLDGVSNALRTADELVNDESMLSFDIMDAVRPAGDPQIVPLISYFSGRDGFSSHVQTLSAPLTTLAECNSRRSNLLTVTHEISHILVQSALAIISPTPSDADQMRHATALIGRGAEAHTMLDAARQLFLEAIVSMDLADRGLRDSISHARAAEELPRMIERTRMEVQEILVHTFDFLYFHQGDPEYYVSNIWHSWCAIPGIADRVPEYLMRTLCAVSPRFLRDNPGTRFEAALLGVETTLARIEGEIGLEGNYVTRVLEYIGQIRDDKQLRKHVETQYFVRMRLVRLVQMFLYSEKLAARLFHDPHVGGGKGYSRKKPLEYDTHPIGNALQFLRKQLKSDPREAESMWVLHALAFDTDPPPLGGL